MGKKPRRRDGGGSTESPETVANADDVEESALTGEAAARAAFVELQALGKQWMEKERAGIALIESFQTALLATRAGGTSAATTAPPKHKPVESNVMAGFLDGADESSAAQMDPWLAEDLFAQIRELPEEFTELLERMYALQREIQTECAFVHQDDDLATTTRTDQALVLTVADYAQFAAHEVAAFEAEYQHVEALLAMISFAITTDQLRTLVISWSTSPFLDPERSREFRQVSSQAPEELQLPSTRL